MAAPEPPEQIWIDDEAGPVVRHYAMTSGRTAPIRGRFDLITLVVACGPAGAAGSAPLPEHAAIISLCQRPVSVAEIATRLDLPVGTIRVLLGDLLDRGLVATRSPIPAAKMPSERVYKAVLDGLRSL